MGSQSYVPNAVGKAMDQSYNKKKERRQHFDVQLNVVLSECQDWQSGPSKDKETHSQNIDLEICDGRVSYILFCWKKFTLAVIYSMHVQPTSSPLSSGIWVTSCENSVYKGNSADQQPDSTEL